MQQEWIANGCRLAWLIDPHGQTVHIYRENGEIQIVSNFDKKLSGENVLEGFELDLSQLKL
jgi:Uma2 family endonuclease